MLPTPPTNRYAGGMTITLRWIGWLLRSVSIWLIQFVGLLMLAGFFWLVGVDWLTGLLICWLALWLVWMVCRRVGRARRTRPV